MLTLVNLRRCFGSLFLFFLFYLRDDGKVSTPALFLYLGHPHRRRPFYFVLYATFINHTERLATSSAALSLRSIVGSGD